MKGFIADIEDRAELNNDFRRVLYTGRNLTAIRTARARGRHGAPYESGGRADHGALRGQDD